MEEKILYKEESYKIIGICMAIHSSFGSGFLEAVYSEVLAKKFLKNDIPFERERSLRFIFNGEKLNKTYRADFLCFNEIIIEIKSTAFIHENFERQLQNYLKATHKNLGIVVNLSQKSLTYKRIINFVNTKN